MAKKSDMVTERSKGTDDDVFAGDKDGAPTNGPRESGGGAGETTRLASGPKGQYRTSVTDNSGNAPYMGGLDAGKGNTNQDDAGTAAKYATPDAGGGIGDEHEESAADQDVDTYYRELSKRRPPNYSKNPNLQTKQAPLELAPVDGAEGYVGSNTGPAVDFNYITGKKGYSEDVPVWGEESTQTRYKDESGSSDEDSETAIKHEEDSRDEFAPWKHVQTDEGLPQTFWKAGGAGDGTPANSDNPDSNGTFGRMGGKGPVSYKTDLNVQDIPSDDSGDYDSSALPQTLFTEVEGGGAPMFKFSGETPPKSLYKPTPRE
jgi:hypothetical protein